jgi:surfactin synthase thioesterase subunit
MLLVLLAHAGGMAQSYRTAFKDLSQQHDLLPLELPGHGRRSAEPLLDNLQGMVASLRAGFGAHFKNQTAEAKTPYAIFGHSMGGLLAYLLAVELSGRDYKPRHVFISSACQPGVTPVGEEFLTLDDQGLWRASIKHFGTLNDEVANNREMMSLFAPIIRADLGAVIRQNYPGWPRLEVPATIFYSQNDIVSRSDMAGWGRYFAQPVELVERPGGHFHVLTDPRPLAAKLRDILNQYQ